MGRVTIEDYFASGGGHILIDVRSPGEYNHAHIPGAKSLPLFTDEERRMVGTAYKQESREKAIKLGLKYFGPKMVKMVETVEKWVEAEKDTSPHAASPMLVVHCWRGGMRSAGVAWLLDLYGFQVNTIPGGYKAFRHWCLRQFEKDHPLLVVGGFTGSAKTATLEALREAGETVIDLEGLACHKGSAFGNINMPPQPSQEMFENLLAMKLHLASVGGALVPQATQDVVLAGKSGVNPNRPIWLEDESQRIGDVNIPFGFYKKMRKAPLYLLDIPFEERLNYIVGDYGKGEIDKLVNAITRIQKRLGGLEAQNAINHLLAGNMKESFSILLRYYDKWYAKGMALHRTESGLDPQWIGLETILPAKAAEQLLWAAGAAS